MNKILVTGSGGFIGSFLVEKLVREGNKVKAFLRYNSKNNWGWLDTLSIKNEIEIVTGDIRDYDSVNRALNSCDTVYHLAALIGIPYSYISPKAYIDTNINGTYNVLEASRQNELEKVIITSTSETYGTAQYVPIDENHRLVGQSPYSASKIAADHLAISYHRSFNTPVKLVRPFNTFGPRQSARAIIPTIILQLLGGKKSLAIGNTEPTRDFTYVTDTVEGFYEIANCDSLTGEVINIGANNEYSIKSIIENISELIGEEIVTSTDENRVRPSESEVDRLRCNNEKLIKFTNWKPKYNFKEALETTISWFKDNMHYYKHEIYNI